MATGRDGGREEALRRIAEVRSRFVDGLGERLDGMAALAVNASADAATAAAARDELRLGLHNLAGAAPTLGLDELGRSAHRIERVVIDKTRPDGGLDQEAAAVVIQSLQTLRGAAAR